MAELSTLQQEPNLTIHTVTGTLAPLELGEWIAAYNQAGATLKTLWDMRDCVMEGFASVNVAGAAAATAIFLDQDFQRRTAWVSDKPATYGILRVIVAHSDKHAPVEASVFTDVESAIAWLDEFDRSVQ